MSQSDRELLSCYVEQGKQEAFRQLVARHTDFVYQAARRQAGQHAEDVMQAVFILLAKKAGSLLRQNNLTGWLFAATRNVSRNALRGERRRRQYEQAAAAEMPTIVEPQWSDMEGVIDEAMAKLTHRDRELLLLRYFQQMETDEMASTLGTTQEAVRVRVRRALGKLREKLKRKEVVTEAGAIEALLLAHAYSAAPATAAAAAMKVAAAIQGGSAAALPAASLAKGIFVMASMKTKVGIAVAAAVLLAGSSAVIVTVVKHGHRTTARAQPPAPAANVKVYRARDGANSLNAAPMPADIRQALVKEQFTRIKTPAGSAATFSGRVEGIQEIDHADIGIVTLRGAQWTLMSNYQYQKINPDGTFSITAKTFPTNRRALAARVRGQSTTYLRAEFEPDESATDIVIRMKPSKQVTLHIADSAKASVGSFLIEEFDGYRVQDDAGKFLSMQRLSSTTGRGGSLTMAMPLEPVSLLVSGEGVAPLYLKIDPREADEFEFQLMSCARVEGIVTRNGEPVEGFAVYLVNDAAPLSAIYKKTDRTGHYTLANGVPGKYRVRAQKQNTIVEVGEGETKQVNFDLNSGTGRDL